MEDLLRKAVHPYSGAEYAEQADGTVLITDARRGIRGRFTVDGAWIEGDLTSADIHFLGFVAGPKPPPEQDLFWMLMPPTGVEPKSEMTGAPQRQQGSGQNASPSISAPYKPDEGIETDEGKRATSFVSLEKMLSFERRPDLVPDVYRKSAPLPGGPKKVRTARYFEQKYHDLEIEHLWSRVWQMACREEDIPEVGDHIIYEIGSKAFIVARTGDNEFRAYVNACMHRGRALRDCPGKRAKDFRCPYHGWRWGLDGKLRDIPAEWDFPGVREDAAQLPEARTGTWGGFVFINPDPDAISLEDYIGPEMIEQFAKIDLKGRYRHAWVGKVLDCNWKVAQEGFVEAYHALATHPQLLTTGGDLTDTRIDVFGNWGRPAHASTSIASPTRGMFVTEEQIRQAWYRSADMMKGYLRTIIGDEVEKFSDTELNESTFGCLFPNFCPWSGFGRIVYRFRPHGNDPDRCLMEIMLLAPWPKDKERPAPAALHMLEPHQSWTDAPEIGALGRIYDQDTRNFPRVQAGLKTKQPDHIWYSAYQEAIIRNFHNIYEERLGLADGE
jgi:phenylpropionate dioxygenase-like ring-hydroxylating dioxygenase large terminal subunit